MVFKEVELKTNLGLCLQCRKILHRGEKIIQGYERNYTGLYTKEFCDSVCLADYKEARASVGERAQRRLSVQFN